MLWLNDSLSSRVALQKRALLFASLTVLILFIFQPFGTYESALSYKYLRLAGYGVATFLAVFIAGLIEIALFKHKAKLNYYPFLVVSLYIAFAAVFNHSYFVVAVYDSWRWENQLMFVFYVSAIAIFPLAILYFRHRSDVLLPLERTSLDPEKDATSKEKETKESTVVTIVGENKSDVLSVALNDIVLLKSADNYCEIFTKKEDTVSISILRISLSKVLEQLSNHHCIVRCHRSFGVNLSLVASCQGNASGLKLNMQFGDVVVPVSRTYVATVKHALSLTPK